MRGKGLRFFTKTCLIEGIHCLFFEVFMLYTKISSHSFSGVLHLLVCKDSRFLDSRV